MRRDRKWWMCWPVSTAFMRGIPDPDAVSVIKLATKYPARSIRAHQQKNPNHNPGSSPGLGCWVTVLVIAWVTVWVTAWVVVRVAVQASKHMCRRGGGGCSTSPDAHCPIVAFH